MGARGTATLNFGNFPGLSDASSDVTGQSSIVADSLVEAWLRPVATANHTADEHLVETLKIIAGDIIAGTGFTIYGFNVGQLNEPLEEQQKKGGRGTRIYGLWTVAWAWN